MYACFSLWLTFPYNFTISLVFMCSPVLWAMFNQTVQDALEKKSGGEEVLEEYQTAKTLKHSTRRQLVNIVVSHMTEIHG